MAVRKKYRKKRKYNTTKKYKGYKINCLKAILSDKKCLVVLSICLVSLLFNIVIVFEYYTKYRKLLSIPYVPTYILVENIKKQEVTPEKAKKYIGKNVCIIRDDFITLYTIYGMVVDVFEYKGEWCLLLKMTYYDQKEMIIKLKDILRIRRRLPNE